MGKTEIIRIALEVIGTAVIGFLANKTFKFKDALAKVISAAKDAVITEAEFQEIVDAIKKDIYG